MTDSAPRPWAAWGLVAGLATVELVLIWGAAGGIDIPRLRATAINFGAFYPGVVTRDVSNFPGQQWSMFLTYGLLHVGLWHLAINALTLMGLAPQIIERVGSLKFLLLYVGAQIGGGLGSVVFGAPWVPVVGASGALFGLAGGIIAWEYADRMTARDRLWPVGRALLILLALNLALWWALDGRLAWETHLGGFVAGWALAFVLDPRPRLYDPD